MKSPLAVCVICPMSHCTWYVPNVLKQAHLAFIPKITGIYWFFTNSWLMSCVAVFPNTDCGTWIRNCTWSLISLLCLIVASFLKSQNLYLKNSHQSSKTSLVGCMKFCDFQFLGDWFTKIDPIRCFVWISYLVLEWLKTAHSRK